MTKILKLGKRVVCLTMVMLLMIAYLPLSAFAATPNIVIVDSSVNGSGKGSNVIITKDEPEEPKAQAADDAVDYAPVETAEAGNVAKIGDTEYATVQAAINAANNGETVVIYAGEYAPINISNKNITIQGTVGENGELLTTIKGGNPAITGHGFNGTIKDIKIVDAFKVMYAEPAGNVTVDNVYVTGATYGFHLVAYSTGLTWTIQNSYMDLSWANSFGVYGGGDAGIVVKGNTFKSTAPYYPELGACSVNIASALPNVTIEENVFGENAKIYIDASVTDTSKISISKNYHADGVGNAFANNSGTTLYINEYYADAAKTNLVKRYVQIGTNYYATLAEAFAAAKAGDEIVLLADVTIAEGTNITIPNEVTLNGNRFAILSGGNDHNNLNSNWGSVIVDGKLTIKGYTKIEKFSAASGDVVTIGSGATLDIVGAGRLSIGNGATFNITGTITDAQTADKATLTPSLIMPGASFTGAGVTFNVTNAYIKAPSSYCSSSKSASGTFDFNIKNSIFETAGKLAFEAQSTAATVNFELKNSVLTTGSHLVFGVSSGEIVIDNSKVNVGQSNQIENQSTMIVKNGSVVNGAVATSSNAKNPGTIIVDNATYAVTGEFSGSDLGTGTLIIKNGAKVSIGSITKANIQIDAENMTAGELADFTANLSKLAGTLEVINNDKLEAKIVDGKIVLAVKPVAKIGDTTYKTLEEAFKAATEGCVIEILADVVINYKWDCRDYATNGSHSQFQESVTINGNGHTLKFTGIVSDNNWNTIFRFEENATVKNLTIDISAATGAQRVITAKKSLTVDGLTIVGSAKYGIIFGEGASTADLTATEIVIKNSTLTGTRRAISDNEGGKDVKSVSITDNTLNANVYVSASESIVFTNNTATGEVDLRSYAAENVLSVEAKGNALAAGVKNYIYAKTFDAQAEFTTEKPPVRVSTKADLNAALVAAQDGDTIILTADIDYGTDQLAITKAITLDLGGKTLTTRNAYGGMSVKNNPTIKNGTIVHASNTAAIKVWNAVAFENLVIDVQGKGDANKTIGGIVLQSGFTTRVGSIKNVTIKGAALTNGIETYNCGDADENVIGSMENVMIDAKGTGMLISAPCGTATNCTIKGGTNAIEIWIKGNYSASLDLVNSDVEGGVFAHDEFNSNPGVVNNGTLSFTADEATTGVDDVTVTIARADTENIKGVIKNIIDNAQAKVENTYYATLAEAIAAVGAGDVVIELLADATLDYNARDAYGTAETTILTINGNGHTLTLNQKNSDWASIGLANANAKLVLNNMTIEKTGYGDTNGAWNTHAIIFSCNVEMTNVVVNNAIAVQNGATLNNVTINEAGGYYGLWINGNGQTVTADKLTINATNGGRGIKIADQYIDSPEKVTLTVTNSIFNTAKKAAVLVSSKAGAAITANNVNITNVTEDSRNIAWVDEDCGAYNANVTVTGATKAQEALDSFVAMINGNYYKTLQAAIDAAKSANNTIALLANNSENVTIKQVEGVNIVIDGNDNEFSGTFTIHGNARYDGAETLTFQNIKFVTDKAEHYFIDSNSTGSVERYAHNVTVKACTFTATGAGKNSAAAMRIRQGFNIVIEDVTSTGLHSVLQAYGNSGIKVNNLKIESGKNGISAGTSTGVSITGAEINVTGYGVRADGTGAYDVTVKNSKITADLPIVVRKNTAEGYKVTLEGNNLTGTNDDGYGVIITKGDDGTYETPDVAIKLNGVDKSYPEYQAKIGDTHYTTLEAAIKAANASETVYVFAGTYAVPSMKAGITIEGVGEVLFKGTLSGTLENLTLKNIHIKGAHAQRWAYAKGKLVFENVTFEATSVYALHFDGIAEGTNLTYKNCTIIGWAAMGGSPASCVFDGCTIKDNGTYGVIRTYFNTTIENCTFDVANANSNDAYQDGIHSVGATITVNNCKNVNGNMKDIIDTSDVGYVVLDGETIHFHKFVAGETVAPTCQAKGYTIYACPCGVTENRDETGIVDHNMVSNTEGYEECSYGCGRYAVTTGNSLLALIAKAKSGDVIKLDNNVVLSGETIVLNQGITLDLNGYTLEAEYFVAFKGNSVTGEGSLKVAKDNAVFATNQTVENMGSAYMPVYMNGAYVFKSVSMKAQINRENGLQIVYVPVFDTAWEKELAEALGDSGLQFVVRISWDNGNRCQDFIFSDSFAYDVYKNGRAFSLRVGALADVEDLNVEIILRSDTGFEVSATVKETN